MVLVIRANGRNTHQQKATIVLGNAAEVESSHFSLMRLELNWASKNQWEWARLLVNFSLL
jgi:hypothetical protein